MNVVFLLIFFVFSSMLIDASEEKIKKDKFISAKESEGSSEEKDTEPISLSSSRIPNSGQSVEKTIDAKLDDIKDILTRDKTKQNRRDKTIASINTRINLMRLSLDKLEKNQKTILARLVELLSVGKKNKKRQKKEKKLRRSV